MPRFKKDHKMPDKWNLFKGSAFTEQFFEESKRIFGKKPKRGTGMVIMAMDLQDKKILTHLMAGNLALNDVLNMTMSFLKEIMKAKIAGFKLKLLTPKDGELGVFEYDGIKGNVNVSVEKSEADRRMFS